jgi:hypothetical protein
VIETFGDLRQWFRERLEAALERRHLRADPETRAYLVELMAAIGIGRRRSPGDVPLALQLKEAREAASGAERLALYRALGDEALCLSGFFADHLERRGISHGYVCSMGGGAYESASVLAIQAPSQAIRTTVYRDLAASFERYAEVLDDVRESTALRTPQDIVRLYDKWRRTGSPRIAERLSEAGVYPAPGAPTTLH